MSHDYDPNWDYPVVEIDHPCLELSDSTQTALKKCITEARESLLPLMNFSEGMDVFFVEPGGLGLGVIAIYCIGTYSKPVVGFDIDAIQSLCKEEGMGFITQFELSLSHELGHAYQESVGLNENHKRGFNEEDAEEFARCWVDEGVVRVDVLSSKLKKVSPKKNRQPM